ncbi:hypothetical protein C8R46DRAFT_625722 [Mycena filopes]|nr:hypothetical protein C8R46DRAFT_625722 [Mycena filopes]
MECPLPSSGVKTSPSKPHRLLDPGRPLLCCLVLPPRRTPGGILTQHLGTHRAALSGVLARNLPPLFLPYLPSSLTLPPFLWMMPSLLSELEPSLPSSLPPISRSEITCCLPPAFGSPVPTLWPRQSSDSSDSDSGTDKRRVQSTVRSAPSAEACFINLCCASFAASMFICLAVEQGRNRINARRGAAGAFFAGRNTHITASGTAAKLARRATCLPRSERVQSTRDERAFQGYLLSYVRAENHEKVEYISPRKSRTAPNCNPNPMHMRSTGGWYSTVQYT